MDADEWQCHQQAVAMKAESGEVCKAGDPEFHLKTVRIMRPIVTQLMHQEIMNVVNETPEAPQPREDFDAAEWQRVMDEMHAAHAKEEAAFAEPSNGDLRQDGPSPNGDCGAPPPSNGKKRHAPAPPDEVAAGNGRFVVS